jgi:hypothetical protein
MNVAELVAKIAERYTCVQGFYAALCQTGEEYVLFNQYGRVDEESRCCINMLAEFDRYAEKWWQKHGGLAKPTLYWRYAPPHVIWYPDDDLAAALPARLRCRLVLSERPVIYKAVTTYERIHQEEDFTDGRSQPQPAHEEQ